MVHPFGKFIHYCRHIYRIHLAINHKKIPYAITLYSDPIIVFPIVGHGTPLHTGIQIDNVSDVGRIQQIDFSPSYWPGSGLANAPAAGGAYASWIYQNGTGIMMRRNDWTNTSFVNIEGYNVGYRASQSVTSPGTYPNGEQYSMNFSNCNTAVQVDGLQTVGIMFSRVTTPFLSTLPLQTLAVTPDRKPAPGTYVLDVSGPKGVRMIQKVVIL